MEIEVLGPAVIDGEIERNVVLHESTASGKGQTVTISVWVPASDSYTALNAAARKEARRVLERALAAIGDG